LFVNDRRFLGGRKSNLCWKKFRGSRKWHIDCKWLWRRKLLIRSKRLIGSRLCVDSSEGQRLFYDNTGLVIPLRLCCGILKLFKGFRLSGTSCWNGWLLELCSIGDLFF